MSGLYGFQLLCENSSLDRAREPRGPTSTPPSLQALQPVPPLPSALSSEPGSSPSHVGRSWGQGSLIGSPELPHGHMWHVKTEFRASLLIVLTVTGCFFAFVVL